MQDMQYLKKYNRSYAPSVFNNSHAFVEDVLDNFLGSYNSTIEATENDNSYSFELELPGFSKSEIEISALGEELSIKAKSKKNKKERSKTITLPPDLDCNKITAKLENGILAITIEKKEEKLFKKIKVI